MKTAVSACRAIGATLALILLNGPAFTQVVGQQAVWGRRAARAPQATAAWQEQDLRQRLGRVGLDSAAAGSARLVAQANEFQAIPLPPDQGQMLPGGEPTTRTLAVPAVVDEAMPARAARPEPMATDGLALPPPPEATTLDAPPAEILVDDITRIQVNTLVKRAERLAADGDLAAAQEALDKAFDLWPESPEAHKVAEMVPGLRKPQPVLREAELNPKPPIMTRMFEEPQTLDGELGIMHRRAVELYNQGDVRGARAIWHQMNEIDPENPVAVTWLEQTESAMMQIMADEDRRTQVEQLQTQAEVLLNSPITISTDRNVSLPEFMYNLSFTTPIELQYYIADGADAPIYANFVNKPLHEVLDTVLGPAGLRWRIDEKNVITIEPDLQSRTYRLTPSQVDQLRALQNSGQLQQIVWGRPDKPSSAVDITLDERANMLIITGSQLHIERIESWLHSASGEATTPDLVTAFYKINPQDGPKIKSLINSIIKTDPDADPFDVEKKILVDGEDLIVHETPENIRLIEELLLNQDFIQQLRDEELDLANFNLIPRDWEKVDEEFIANVVEMIEVFLYGREGRSAAEAQGRRLTFDDATLTLSIIDTPSRLEDVGTYINSLPQFQSESQQEIVFLKYQIAEELAANLERILNLTSTGGAFGTGGSEIVMQLRRGEEQTFQNARFRAIEFQGATTGSQDDDRYDQEVRLQVIYGGQVNETSIRELTTTQVEDFEITGEDITANENGNGRARLRIRYIPQLSEGIRFEDERLAQQLLDRVDPLEEDGISIEPFGGLNALIIRYNNLPLYQQAKDLIVQLDQPIRQVEIDTKFVEVNETRAKEFSSDFNIAGLGRGRDIDWSNQMINTKFAQDIDEFRDVFSPPVENPLNANLIKGTTVFNAIIGNFPNIQYTLRLLEAEAIINIVNGPKVLALDGEEAEFRIETYVPQQNLTQGNQTLTRVFNAFENAGNELEFADQDEVDNQGLVSGVVLRVTPEITSADSIILSELSAELIDFEGWLADIIEPVVRDVADLTEDQFFTPIVAPTATSNYSQRMVQKRKKILTDARISNGGTIVIGGWTGERSQELTSGVPVLRNMPYFGKLLFSRNQTTKDRTTLLIFLTCLIIE
ncbi:MAG TPA: hypothetical protein PLS90_04535 [Candidatus Sumerlaeota bacterium]|nr:hypothetical protein [Candidatus Sumerlaeota bacterium]HOR28241.1 hypothetical protein [Candidatus Sumerlaeota bacterium]HPK01705.1 hypothetical protein [Candidatus Sumerlaeota bacterium]